ncbi:MAG TPA: polyprenyl synthetase family protein, partial [Methylococcaceae bacterium]|nr:polyprenyl synthetase family protein [Methylococcaceae bacterium]
RDPALAVGAEQRLAMIEALAQASGAAGMVGGQAIDLASVGQKITLPELENMHIHKTGALIRASVRLAALAKPGLEDDVVQRLDRYAKCIGLSFQIQDDILDEESDTQTLGKTQGKDRDHDKPTYPALLGMADAKRKALEMHEAALSAVDCFGGEADHLRALSRYIIERRN